MAMLRSLGLMVSVCLGLQLLAVPAGDAQESKKNIVLGSPGTQAILPPELPWNGRSRRLARPPADPWATPSEQAGLVETPRYDETMAWLQRLAGASEYLEMVSLGKSPQGRDIWMMVASKERAFTPEAMAETGKPVLLAQAGIHSGEIDGKDAGMMILRDIAVGDKGGLIDEVSVLFIPIFNVDGHERFSRFNRINQRGPAEMGWRTTSRNLNLNRDYAKVDSPEMRALILALRSWDPDLYLDIHVTDGVDYQYDITWGYNGPHSHSPNAAAWLDAYLTPGLTGDLQAMGHVPGTLVFVADPSDVTEGNNVLTFNPRYSNGYGDARHLPTVLVENHSLKPYPQRVLGTYVLLESTLRILALHGRELQGSIKADRKHRRKTIPLDWELQESPAPTGEFLGVDSRMRLSPVSGGFWVEWTGEPRTFQVPVLSESRPTTSVSRPRAYWIPPEWGDLAARLRIHGIEVEEITEAQDVEVSMYRIEGAALEDLPYEGHVRVNGFTAVPARRVEPFPAGSFRVSTDQPLGDLAILLLEPEAADSFFRWGMMLEVLQRTEYVESYVMEPLASRMLAETPGLENSFTERLSADPEFAADPKARLMWFYERTPFFDQKHLLYPIAREE